MENTTYIILEFVIGIVFIATWIVLVKNVIVIRKKLEEKSNSSGCITEAKIANMSGNREEALKWYYRALYFDWENHPQINQVEVVKKDLTQKYHDKIISFGGIWPEKLV